MIGDPNWLYSTIAQSSAAIVAIVGGFITASVLMLLAEKRSLMNQLKDKKARLEGLETQAGGWLFGTRGGASESFREDEISSLEAEVLSLEARLKAFAYPPRLELGVVILICFAFGSIVLPVSLIWMEKFSPILKLFTFYVFMAGLVAVLSYIGLQLKELRRKRK